MAKNYVISFGSSNLSGLAPTFLTFATVTGVSTTRPGITEIPTNTGLYYFTYGPTNTIAYIIDGATTTIPATSRYLSGSIDPIDAVDEQLTGIGSSLIAQGVSISAQGASILAAVNAQGSSAVLAVLGTTASSFGDTATMPSTIFGYLKRLKEFNEGVSDFSKSTGVWNARASTFGSSTQLFQRTMSDTSGTVSKT